MLGLWAKGGFRKYWSDTIWLYDDLFLANKTKNRSAEGREMISNLGRIGADFVGSYDGERTVYYYVLKSFPRNLFVDFKDLIRDSCKAGVRVNFVTTYKPHTIHWNSVEMKNRLRILSRVDKDKQNKDVDSFNLHSSIGSMDKQSWIRDSLAYLSLASIRRGRSLFRISMVMMVLGDRGENLDLSVRAIERIVANLGLNMERVLYDVPEIVGHFSPFKRMYSKDSISLVPELVLSDEVASRFNTYAQGTLGVSGTYIGSDVYSLYPVLKRFKPRTDSAEVFLVTAETGGGKSNFVKDMLLQLLSSDINGTIMDVEGNEYTPIANYLSVDYKVVTINMGEGTGRYLDPLEISKPVGLPEIDEAAKTLATNFTLSYFKSLLSGIPDNDGWLDIAINEAVSYTYVEAGVTDDPSTWYKSSGLTLYDVYYKFVDMYENKFRTNVEYLAALEKAVAVLNRYFTPEGLRNYIFKNRVNISDIIDAKLVVCSFGMAGKSPTQVDPVQMALMQLGAAQVSHQRSLFSFQQGVYNAKVWEEFQRWGNFPGSDKTIGVAVTGGRKLGDINFIITNFVADLLRNDVFGIFGNITSFLIGAISDRNVRIELCDRLSVPHMLPDLDDIAKAKKADDGEDYGGDDNMAEDPLTYAFLAGLDRSKYSIVKVFNPDAIKDSKLYKTGVDTSVRDKSSVANTSGSVSSSSEDEYADEDTEFSNEENDIIGEDEYDDSDLED